MAKRKACPMCGEPIDVEAESCPQCGEEVRRKGENSEGDQTGGVIPYKNPAALIGYYCGVFSLIPILGAFLGVVAVILGIMGLRNASQNPAVKGKVHAWIAIALGGLCAILWGSCLGFSIFSVLAASTRARY